MRPFLNQSLSQNLCGRDPITGIARSARFVAVSSLDLDETIFRRRFSAAGLL